jgi:hypothetical protein
MVNAKKQAIKERVVYHTLKKIAANEKLTPDQKLEQVRNQYLNEKTDDQELKNFLANKGLDIRKLSKEEIAKHSKTLASIKLMNRQKEYMNGLVDEKEIKIKTAE